MTRMFLRVAIVTALLLLIPAIAMQFTDEMNWGPGDFAVAGVLVFCAGTAIALASRKIQQPARRHGVIAGIAFALLLVWAELAVGIFH